MSELAQLGVGRDRRLEAVVGWRGGVIGGSGPAVVIMGCVAHHLRARARVAIANVHKITQHRASRPDVYSSFFAATLL